MNMLLRLTLSCLTGIGALCLLATLLVVGYVVVTLRRLEHETPQQLGDATFTRREAERLTALKYRVEQEHYTSGAEYDSTC